ATDASPARPGLLLLAECEGDRPPAEERDRPRHDLRERGEVVPALEDERDASMGDGLREVERPLREPQVSRRGQRKATQGILVVRVAAKAHEDRLRQALEGRR